MGNTNELDNFGEIAQERVDRASKQKPNADNFFTSTYNWVKKAEMDEPLWGYRRGDWVDNRIRDEWLQMTLKAEPHLASVLSTAISLDANRQYRLVGGRNQVQRFVRKFNEFDDGLGFRALQEFNASNFYNTDLGAVVEIETDDKDGPLQSLYHSDSTRFRLGQKRILKYDTNDLWDRNQYYRLSSLKSTQDKYNMLGYCAASRCLKLAQIMIAVVEHNLEKLGQLAPKGILFIQAEDLTQEAWEEARLAEKEVYITNTGNQYYEGVMTIVDRLAKGELLALSQLPDNFDTFMFTDYMLKGYALAFGRDVRAFWSLNSGNFGGGTEAKIQNEKATYAGGAEFILASQEQIQWLLPSSLLFEYEVEDTGGKVQQAELEQLLIESSKTLLDVGFTTQQAQTWLAERGVIPVEWTEDEEVEVAANGVLKSRYLDTMEVQRALESFPEEPIVYWESPSLKHPRGKMKTLWRNKDEAIKKGWHVKKNLERQIPIEDLDEENRGNEMYVNATEAYLESVDEDRLTDEQLEALLLARALLSKNEEITDDDIANLDVLLIGAIGLVIVDKLRKLRDKSNEALPERQLEYPELWESRISYFRNLGFIALGDPDEELTWRFGDTKHCTDCSDLNGVTMTRLEWLESGIVPQSPDLECKGYHCQCTLS